MSATGYQDTLANRFNKEDKGNSLISNLTSVAGSAATWLGSFSFALSCILHVQLILAFFFLAFCTLHLFQQRGTSVLSRGYSSEVLETLCRAVFKTLVLFQTTISREIRTKGKIQYTITLFQTEAALKPWLTTYPTDPTA